MNKIKKTILTLVALLAVTTGAWAQEQWDVVWDFTAWSTETVTALKADAAASKTEGWSDVEKAADAEAGADPTAATKDKCFWSCSGTVNADGNLSANGVVIKEFQGLKFNSDYAAKRSLAIAVNYPSTTLGDYAGGAYLWLGGSKQTCFTIPGVKAGSKITIEVESNKTSSARGIGLYKNSYAAENLIGEQFTPTTLEAKTWEIAEDCNVVVYNTNNCHIYTIKVKAPAASSASAVTVDWNKASKTGTFDMPGGNVELEPEYYPQATLTAAPTAADGAKATTDDLLVSGGTVATITGSDPAAPQGTLMYYVSTSTMTTEALLALDADKWVAEPTAAGITQKCVAFVYYYVKGNDSTDDALNFSDGDISSDNVLDVLIYPAPTYAVTFADDTAEPTLWTASPAADVTKGQTVTVTYTGTKKVIGVKAEKKAAGLTYPIALSAVTSDYIGSVVTTDGNVYATVADATAASKTAAAMIAYVSGTGQGLALALADESEKMNWNTAKSTCSGKTPAVTGCTWKLATQDEWNNMINAAGGFSALRDGFSSVGGTNMLSGSNDYYWSSTTTGYDCAWSCTFSTGNWTDDYADDYTTDYVRACLAF